jgi:hypothetical protein
MQSGAQLQLRFPNRWGGARRKAGRKPQVRRSMPHRARAKHSAAIPVHVTLRVALKSLRSQFVFPTVRGAIVAANRRGELRFRIVHYSVQSNHLHLVVEALAQRDLLEGIRGFYVSLVRRINRPLFRKGRLIADRWHGRPLKTPRSVRHALVYLFGNAKKHGEPVAALDPLSSAPHFRGFREFPCVAPIDVDPNLVPRFARGDPPPAPRSWLMQGGLLRCERISIRESPRTGSS